MASSQRATLKFSGPLMVGVEIDVKDFASGKWYQAEIIKSEFFKIEIKYKNLNSQYNTEWISTEKELDRIEPLGTHTTVKIDETNDNNESDNVNDAKTEVLIDYFDDSSDNSSNNNNNNNNDETEDTTNRGAVLVNYDANANKNKKRVKKQQSNKEQQTDSKSNEIISLLESKVKTLEYKLQTAFENDHTLNNKVNQLSKENEALKLKAQRMSKEIKTLKKMLNEMKSEDKDNEAWEEVE